MVAKQTQIKDHVLLLKHVKLNEKAVEEILNKYNIDKMQLPLILKKDPVLRGMDGMDVKEGDIIEIERNSVTVNKTKFYRVVVGG